MGAYSRRLIGVYMDWLVHSAGRIGYEQVRPMGTHSIDGAVSLRDSLKTGFDMDCSESVTLLCHLGGLRPPSGETEGYAFGNTSTLMSNLPHLGHASDLLLGDLAVFNADQPLSKQHVAACRVPGSDPKMFNHGSAPDPRYFRLSQLQPGFAGHTVYLSLASL